MIAKRIRKGTLQPRGSAKNVARLIVTSTSYVWDADTEALMQAEGITALTGYALDQALAELGASVGEKVLAAGSRNLKGTDLATWQAQMIATALRCPSSKNPIEHIVISWQRDEQPTIEQIEEAVAIAVEVLGCAKNQVVWGAHQNTENIHVHLVINRVDPVTGTMTQLGDGWDKDRLAQARAVIEARQGWRSEKDAKYVANAAGVVRRRRDNAIVRTADGKQHHKKGQRAEEEALWREHPANAAKANAILRAKSWAEVHAELGKLGAIIAVKGSGAVIITEEGEEKASRYHRKCSLPELLSRFDDFVPVRHDEPTFWRANMSELDTIKRELLEDRAAKIKILDEHERERRNEAQGQVSREIEYLSKTQAIADQARATKAALKAHYQRELQRVEDARVSEDEWGNGIRRKIPSVAFPSLLFPKQPLVFDEQEVPPPEYDTRKVGSSVEYTRRRAASPAFIDHKTVIIVMSRSDDDVLAALKIGQKRWGTVSVFGDRAFVEQCLRVAEANGIPINQKSQAARRLDLPNSVPTTPVREAEEPESTYPNIYTTAATRNDMIFDLYKAGFQTNDNGQVRFNREIGIYQAFDEGLDADRRAQLKKLVAKYTTQAAADACLAEHWKASDARLEAEANASELVANFERTPVPKPQARTQTPVLGTEATSDRSEPSAPRQPAPSASTAVRRMTDEQYAAATSERPPEQFGHHRLIEAWAKLDPAKVAERRRAVLAIGNDPEAMKAVHKLQAADRQMLAGELKAARNRANQLARGMDSSRGLS